MRDRHWAQLMGVTKKTFEKADTKDEVFTTDVIIQFFSSIVELEEAF